MEGLIIEASRVLGYKGTEERVVIPEGIRAIGEEAFLDSAVLKEIVIPETVEEIGEHAFKNAAKLEKIIFKGALPEMGMGTIFGIGGGLTVETEATANEFILAQLPKGKIFARFEKYGDFGGELEYPEYIETCVDIRAPFGTDYAPFIIDITAICHGDGSAVKLSSFPERISFSHSSFATRHFKLPDITVKGSVSLPSPDFEIADGRIAAAQGKAEIPLPEELFSRVLEDLGSEASLGCGEGDAVGYTVEPHLYLYENKWHDPFGSYLLAYTPIGEDGSPVGRRVLCFRPIEGFLYDFEKKKLAEKKQS